MNAVALDALAKAVAAWRDLQREQHSRRNQSSQKGPGASCSAETTNVVARAPGFAVVQEEEVMTSKSLGAVEPRRPELKDLELRDTERYVETCEVSPMIAMVEEGRRRRREEEPTKPTPLPMAASSLPGASVPAVAPHEQAVELFRSARVLAPDPFSGREEDFPAFRKDVENMLIPYGIDQLLDAAVRERQEPDMRVMPKELADWGRLLYSLLAALTKRAQTAALIADSVQDRNGWAVWRRLVHYYQPQERDRQVSVYASLLNPTWSEDLMRWYEDWLQWESTWARYCLETGRQSDDEAKVANLLRFAPPVLQDFLRMSPDSITRSYDALREAILAFCARSRIYVAGVSRQAMFGSSETAGRQSQSFEASLPPEMDISLVKKTKGAKGKGKTKKGTSSRTWPSQAPPFTSTYSTPTVAPPFERECIFCGQLGHKRDECLKYIKAMEQAKKETQAGEKPDFSSLKPGSCFRCGQYGHLRSQCNKSVGAISEEPMGQQDEMVPELPHAEHMDLLEHGYCDKLGQELSEGDEKIISVIEQEKEMCIVDLRLMAAVRKLHEDVSPTGVDMRQRKDDPVQNEIDEDEL